MNQPDYERLLGTSKLSIDKPFRVIGIDLGTTNSSVCEIVCAADGSLPTNPNCLNIDQETNQGRYTNVLVPSVVAVNDGKITVGEGAKRLRAALGAGLGENQTWFGETKNDIGTRRTYHKATAGYRSARAIATELLQFLNGAAITENDVPISRTVVTVPASFQTAQRDDTVSAAQRAKILLADGELLDEPIAAFLDYFIECRHGNSELLPRLNQTKKLIVFDFGGGTCDVAVFQLQCKAPGDLSVSSLSVSRYHRLGGGDIDRAIIHEVLIPQLIEQNGLDPFAFTYEDKRLFIQPALLGVAEALKEKLSIEIARLKKFGRWEGIDRSTVLQILPGVHEIEFKNKRISLTAPKLSAEQFDQLLAPFIDRDEFLPREDEYRVTCSIFAPLDDALLRGRLEPDQIDLCLLAGGSSLLPQIQDAIKQYFPNAQILTFPNREHTQTAVAKGAALHALSLVILGRPFLQTVCHDEICFRTRSGPVILIPPGTKLPYPAGSECERRDDFKAPEFVNAGDHGSIRIEIVAGDEQRLLYTGVWEIAGPLRKGDPLWLEFRLDENQVLHLSMGKRGEPVAFAVKMEHPLTHVVNPNKTRDRIEHLEEELRLAKLPPEESSSKFEELGDLCRTLRQYEKAIACYRRSIQLRSEPGPFLLNRMAFCARDLGDRDRADRFFSQADRMAPWSGTWFNWALAKEQWGQFPAALQCVEKAIGMDDAAPYLVLKARLLKKIDREEESGNLISTALSRFGLLISLDQFHLTWLRFAAETVGNHSLARQAEAEMTKRNGSISGSTESEGELPEVEMLAMGDER